MAWHRELSRGLGHTGSYRASHLLPLTHSKPGRVSCLGGRNPVCWELSDALEEVCDLCCLSYFQSQNWCYFNLSQWKVRAGPGETVYKYADIDLFQ